jgi:protein-disulfide isomerase
MRRGTPLNTLAVPVGPADHVIGPATAHLVVVEYGDFECPYCAQAYPAVKMILNRFEHRIGFVFRHYPVLGEHPHAELAAEAAEAAGAQGKFWPMHDRLFQNQRHLEAKSLRQYAADLELDLERYDSEMADHLYLQRVQEHLEGGRASGVRGTPAFFVDEKLVDASFGMKRLVDAVDAAIARART